MSDGRVASAAWDVGPPPEVSVIVPTHDRRAYLSDVVAAMEAQTLDPERFELIVVDDASTDDTWDQLRRLASGTSLRMLAARLEANAGPAGARNHAAAAARGSFLAFTDDDCVPASGWLEAIVAGLGMADVVQGRTLPLPAEQRAAGPWARTVWITERSNLFETCNLGWRREAFDSLGGFSYRPGSPRGTRAHFGEDAELGWRMLATGGGCAYEPAALVHHRVHAGTFADWLAEKRRMGLFPSLVRRAPGLRRSLTLRLFLSTDTAAFDLAVAGLIASAALRGPLPALAAAPWLASRWRQARHRPGRPRPVRVAQLALGDVVGLGALIAGSLRARTPVL